MSAPKETKPFDYCASPDGEDVAQKLGVLLKPMALTSFAISTVDVMLYSHPRTYLETLGRYIHFSWPIFGASAAFVLGSNLAGSIRNKDDKLNWFIGGMASGSVYGIWRRHTIAGLSLGILLGIVAVAKKDCIQNNTHMLIPDKIHVQYGGFRAGHQDFTLTSQRPGNWTTGPKE